MRLKKLILLAVLATGLPLSAQTAVGPCKMDGSDCATGGGGSGDVESVAITTSSPLTGSATCTTGACSFTLGLGTVPATKGGTGLTTFTLGDIVYSSATNTLSKLAGNTTTTKKFLMQVGDGAASAAPVWTATAADFPTQGFAYDPGEGAWIYTPASGNSDTRILSDYIGLQDASGADIMALDSTLGATTYVAGRLAADAIEVRGSSSLAASGTITATNVTCSTSSGAVVGTLNADAANVGRFVYVTRDGANTCTIGVASGQTLDGVTDGTTTVPSAGWKTFVQTTSTAWVTAGSYPVTGTLSGLTATRIPVATSATAVGDSAITHNSTTGVTTFGGSGPKLELTEGSVYPGSAASGVLALDGDAYVVMKTGGTQIGYFAGNTLDGWNGNVRAEYVKASVQIWGSSSKALVDATATAFMFVYLDTGGYDGGTVEYVINATDGTDKQVRSGSVPFSAFDTAGTATCTFGTASDVAHVSVGTLTVTWDCTDAANGVYLRANVDTSLASTTVFTIKSRVNTQGRAGSALPQ